jgi:site-specific DNA recombinase
VNRQLGQTPEDHLLLQMQGMIAEYERAKILERNRRGKLHGARTGKPSVLSSAPYGYRYVPGGGGCAAQYNVHLPEAAVVKEIFHRVGMERMSLGQVCKTLEKQGILSPTGMDRWNTSTLQMMLANPAYKGTAAYGKTCRGPMRRRLRPVRGSNGIPRDGQSVYRVPPQQWIGIAVPAIIEESLFERVAEQLEENRKRFRQRRSGAIHLLQGLLVCAQCGYACHGTHSGRGYYCYYRCLGSQPCRCGGKPLCRGKLPRQDLLDAAVWNDVRQLLSDPKHVQRELQRRLDGADADGQQETRKKLQAQMNKVRRGIARLIDAYEQGLVDKSEFEPRIKSARQQLEQLEQQMKQQADEQTRQKEMKLVIDNLKTFSAQVTAGLNQADWQTRRQVITTLVKRVELEKEQVKIVYRVDLFPFDRRPKRGGLEHRTTRESATVLGGGITSIARPGATKFYCRAVALDG